ncbi:hypothetical protein ACFUMH_05500 [Cellulomonas sp. NPDC057328]|uniref:hypothetical protein n=1 Tax=Cellulomonas sp. NPDC057328 TaxID=3346101 RepID=UPI00364560B1
MTAQQFTTISLIEDRTLRESSGGDFGVPGSAWATVVQVAVGNPAHFSWWWWPRQPGEWRVSRFRHRARYDFDILARVRSPQFVETSAHFVSPVHGPRAVVLDAWDRERAYALVRAQVDGARGADVVSALRDLQRTCWVHIPDDDTWFDVPMED